MAGPGSCPGSTSCAITTIRLGEEMESENRNLGRFHWAILVSASAWLTVLVVWLTIPATTMPGLQSDINVPSAQLCLRARDFIQLGRSRVYAETADEVGRDLPSTLGGRH
ncbi:hypothetical protein EDB83DRAFT_2318979 [Lactarius deliciosus]|nr:hypothetical protein EDB83DRAFT_2318979 [Lactarius deliciosus]